MPKVLIVDDDREQLDLYGTAFKLKGYSVEKVSSGEEGLRQARASKPDLILLDLVMPGMDGLECLKWLRADELTKDIKIILMTNMSRGGLVEEVAESGADDFVMKADLTPTELAARVKKLI